ncbi:hypothetical protein K435DRAFT_780898 [Dendrothele bispora CBS 962.96]|uniref:Uncharacterized protein n=1 Tax=Dendrothele bispora (strain CBS 962.96) TaxID=1314807 RepID=A0A4V4HEJ9_DENBC|nr:hypothetical protein K435DRAFT_780898 [Dendrothele bispora CBS 962.96]
MGEEFYCGRSQCKRKAASTNWTLGQRALAQQMELEEQICQLQELEQDRPSDEQLDDDARERYKESADTLIAWDAENAQLSAGWFFLPKPPRFLSRSRIMIFHDPKLIFPCFWSCFRRFNITQMHSRQLPGATTSSQMPMTITFSFLPS